MALMSTCLARLGSRFSITFDPNRREIDYGTLGLLCQQKAGLVVGIEQDGRTEILPLAAGGSDFFCVDQFLTMTSLRFEARSRNLGIALSVTITAPFWPRDEKTSLVPAYLFDCTVRKLDSVRWRRPQETVSRKGSLILGLRLPGAKPAVRKGALVYDYPVLACDVFRTGEGGADREYRDDRRKTTLHGTSRDILLPLKGPWRVRGETLAGSYDCSGADTAITFSASLIGYCGDALFERFGAALPLKYTAFWSRAEEVAEFVRQNADALREKSRSFDRLFAHDGLPAATRDLMAVSFQSYLLCSLWATGPVPDRTGKPGRNRDWFSVWEGSCWFNSTVDVTYNEAPFYFACWPELMEILFEEWSEHTNSFEDEKRRRARCYSDDDRHGNPLTEFPGAILEHDMGAGWSANGQSYHHAMPVEENANFLLLLYAHAKWWNREALFRKHAETCRLLTRYLLWSDSTGNGFPDRGTANTIDDANPAVQYGRDNVYLGVKRLCALHAAARILETTGDAELAAECRRQVRRAVATLNAGWLGDHFPVVLDKSARGLADSWSGKPLPYRSLPGWDGYSLYTSNGMLFLLMVGDLPPGIDLRKIRTDLRESLARSMTPYGCAHSDYDDSMVWVSMNMWRDCVAAYLGDNLLPQNERYWAQQVFANGIGSEKPNCFTETSLRNNLVWYPRGAASFAYTFAYAGLVLNRSKGIRRTRPAAPGRWPLLPLADWKKGRVPATGDAAALKR